MPSLFPVTDRTGLPQTTKSGIFYEIDALDYRERWQPGHNSTTVTCRVDAEDSWDWITDMVGRVTMTTLLRRDLPEQNPFDSKQWCTRVEQVDQGGLQGGANDAEGSLADDATGWPFTKWQRYRVTFENMPFRMRTDSQADTDATNGGISTVPELLRYVIRTQKNYAREQQIPGGNFKIIDDVTPANRVPLFQTGFKTRVYGDVAYVWTRVPVENLPSAIRTMRGKINSVDFDASPVAGSNEGYEFSAGELLYVGFDDTNRYFDANEDYVVDIVLNFKFCQGGWNFYFDSSARLVEVSDDGTSTGNRPYETATFNSLFTPA